MSDKSGVETKIKTETETETEDIKLDRKKVLDNFDEIRRVFMNNLHDNIGEALDISKVEYNASLIDIYNIMMFVSIEYYLRATESVLNISLTDKAKKELIDNIVSKSLIAEANKSIN